MNAETRAKEIAMTPEERARAFVQEHRGFDLDGNCWFIACDRAEANLTQALRKAENDKLEEAARELDLSLLANIEDAPKDWLVGFDYARDRVLSLKSKD